jgi:hypothetical protein
VRKKLQKLLHLDPELKIKIDAFSEFHGLTSTALIVSILTRWCKEREDKYPELMEAVDRKREVINRMKQGEDISI